ncbi:hypothetical protein DL93DRAFT_1333564 [Clavulina sp. PMI_390]|nr:hypothetical protein DL93DRAFT_1333564 [Clavulina sp. PMI_390]
MLTYHLKSIPQEAASLDIVDIDPIVQARLDVPPAAPIPNSPTLGVTRQRISHIFGGGVQAMISNPAKNKVTLNNTLNLCFQPSWNPLAPSQPGEHGLLFRSPEGMVSEIPSPEPNGVTLFRCNGTNNWVYMGQYRARRVDAISPVEWETLGDETKQLWFQQSNIIKGWRDKIHSLMKIRRTGEDVTKALFTTAMRLGLTKLDCWLFEFIRYRHEYFDVLAGNITVAEAQAKAESPLEDWKSED